MVHDGLVILSLNQFCKNQIIEAYVSIRIKYFCYNSQKFAITIEYIIMQISVSLYINWLTWIQLARSPFKPQHSTCIERKTDVWRTEIKILPCCSDPSHHCKNQICSVRVFRLLQLFSTSLSWAPLSSIRETQRVCAYSSPRPLMYYIRAQHCMNLLSLKTIFIRKDFPRKKRQPNFIKLALKL